MVGIIRYTISLFTIGFASLVWAVSIYDVIELSQQGYSDEEVLNIIRSTGSVFELTAEDIPRLKNLGVGEAVIRGMLVVELAESSERGSFLNDAGDGEQIPPADSAIANDDIEEITPATSEGLSQVDSADHEHAASPPLTPNRFSIHAVSEEAAGGHQHAYVTLSSVPILILRDEGRFQSIEDRGRAIVSNLEEAVRMGVGRFKVLQTEEADLVVYQGAYLREVPIVTVNHRDAHAYDVRSERRVTTDLLASYWAALLSDYWAITFQHRAPSLLVNLHRGDALMLLFEVVNRTGSDEPLNLGLAVQQLPRAIQSHLERLAAAVPDDFDTRPEYVGERS